MDSFAKLLGNCYRFLSFRPRSEKEVREYIGKKISNFQFPISNFKNQEELIVSIIEKLKQKKFLDDFEFAKWFIELRSKIKPKALKFITYELHQKGISKELIEEVLQSSELEVVSDFQKALDLATKRLGRYKNEDPKKTYEKMFRFLASKGFDYDTIKKVIDQVISKH